MLRSAIDSNHNYVKITLDNRDCV